VNDHIGTAGNNLQTYVEANSFERLRRINTIVDRYSGRSEYLIPALKDAQEMFGFLSLEVQHELAGGFHVTPAHVYGVVTFYSFFTILPRGRHTVRLCQGTACYVKGATDILQNVTRKLKLRIGETSPDGRFTVEAVRCLGACGLAPVVVVDADTHGNIDPARALTVLERYQ